MDKEIFPTSVQTSGWEHQLRRMTDLGRADKHEALKDALVLLALAFVARRDLLEKVEARDQPANAVRKWAEMVESHGELKGHLISDTLLSGLPGVRPDVISQWLFIASEDLSGEGFAEWFTEKLDGLEFARHHDTPLSLSRLIASLFSGHAPHSILDPACGSGGLLATVAKATAQAALFGQEVSAEACAWAKLRFLVLGLADTKLAVGNALTQPAFSRTALPQGFDLVLANPPFGMHFDAHTALTMSNDLHLAHGFSSRVSSETAYVHEIFGMLSDSGAGVIIVPMGFLTRGGIDQKLREALIQRDVVEAVIGLPERLFAPASSIDSAILFLSRRKTLRQSKGVLFVDARQLGRREGVRTVLDETLTRRIEKVFSSWNDEPGFACAVSSSDLDRVSYSLSPARYIVSVPKQDTIHAEERRARIAQLDARLACLTEEYEALRSRLA